jgi:predicted site-specific integrase-resolvase
MEVLTNRVVCPYCTKEFDHSRVNGIALLEIVQRIETHKRMHCRLTLDAIERAIPASNPAFKNIKKAVLDGYNDLARDVHTILGFGNEAE